MVAVIPFFAALYLLAKARANTQGEPLLNATYRTAAPAPAFAPTGINQIDLSGAFDWLKGLFGGFDVSIATDNALSPHNERDLDTLARTCWGEARNEGFRGMQAVANVVMNRYAAAQRSSAKARAWGDTVHGVCMKPKQFSAWNLGDPNRNLMLKVDRSDSRFRDALDIAERALTGQLPDVTGGADHYLNVEFTKRIRGGTLPNWADLRLATADIGQHTFLRLG